MRPGEVTSDQQAFQQVLGRLEGDVGTLIQLVNEGKNHGYFPNTAPFWALVRMMFPIAESVGDLIYRDSSPAKNLISVFEKEFEAVRAGYLGKAKILAQLYRHSLIHQDELRVLQTGGKECGWVVSFDGRPRHLKITRVPPRDRERLARGDPHSLRGRDALGLDQSLTTGFARPPLRRRRILLFD